MKRRIFVRNMAITGLGVGTLGLHACTPSSSNEQQKADKSEPDMIAPFFKLSLAQWSIHKMIQKEGLDPYQFAALAKKWGFEGLEHVSQLYMSKKQSMGGEGFTTALDAMVRQIKEEAKAQQRKSLIMMMDLEDETGDLAWADDDKRTRALEAHYPWVEATKEIGCHSIRVNLFGETDRVIWKPAAIDAMARLGEFAKGYDINVIVENHGWLSSDAALLMEVINEVGMDNVGTLPDFGNFCVKRPDGARWDGCLEEYDRYQGVTEMMPNAFAVSAKSSTFNTEGEEVSTDYMKMLQIVKDAGYTGYIGVEYDMDKIQNDLIKNEEEGVLATKELLLNAAKQLT